MNSNQVKLIRQYKEMTQEQFATWLGVSLAAVALIEAGHRDVSENIRSKIAHKFDVKDPAFIEYVERVKQTANFFNAK